MEDFWNPSFDIERRADGSILMAQKDALPPHLPTLPASLRRWAGERADQTWLAERRAIGAAGWREVSYAQGLAAVREIGAGLLALGLGPDRPLLILSENSVDHALMGMAAMYAGVPYAPLSTAYSLVSTDHGKLRDIAALLQPGAIFAADGATYAAALAAIAGPQVISTRNPGAGAIGINHLRGMGDVSLADAACDRLTPDTVGKYLFTSGSTGSPKAVINSQAMMTSNQAMVTDCFRFLAHKPPVVVDWAPWNHTASGNKVFNMILVNGGTFHIDGGRPSPALIGETIRNLREISPSYYFNVPVGLDMLAREMQGDAALRESFFADLKILMYAGAGLAQHTWDALKSLSRQTLGHEVLVSTGLGATETGPFALMCTTPQDRPGNIGVPARGVTLKLVPNEDKLEARLKCPAITPGYYGDAARTADSLDEEGFYKLGDALRPADPEDLTKGFLFDGRVAENFKLGTGTWVAVGALRAAMVDAFGGLLRDVVILGENRDYLGALGLPDEPALRAIGSGADLAELAADPGVRAALAGKLADFSATATGSATRVRRLIVLTDPPDLDRGEVTDKGSINQRAVIRHRTHLVEALYGDDPRVIQA